MKKFLLIGLVFPFLSFAHSGRTSSDGCHYCRTNCSFYGVQQDARHCHGGYSAPSTPKKKSCPTNSSRNYSGDECSCNNGFTEKNNKCIKKSTQPKKSQVLSIIDGDTVKVSRGDNIEKIRIIGIDTPETKDPRYPVQCFGKEATMKAIELLKGRNIMLETKEERGKYGRLLAYIKVDGRDFGETMIREGFAFHYRKYKHDRIAIYNTAERYARENNKGLWDAKSCNGEKRAKKIKSEKKANNDPIETRPISIKTKVSSKKEIKKVVKKEVENIQKNIPQNLPLQKIKEEEEKSTEKPVKKEIENIQRSTSQVLPPQKTKEEEVEDVEEVEKKEEEKKSLWKKALDWFFNS
jgi:micrococcal nuclease